jgi:hypothetical protein
LRCAATIGSQQHDLRPQDMLLRTVSINHDPNSTRRVGFAVFVQLY